MCYIFFVLLKKLLTWLNSSHSKDIKCGFTKPIAQL